MKKILFVGLGNPGEEYKKTKHNAGSICLNYIKNQLKLKENQIVFNNFFCYFLDKPDYMNICGGKIQSTFKIGNFSKLIVFYDEANISFGEIKIKKEGSVGTHNGLRTIRDSGFGENFIRIGIGFGKDKTTPLKDQVLVNFSEKELNELDFAFFKIYENIFINLMFFD